MDIKSIMLLHRTINLLMQALDVLNKIPEEDYKEMAMNARRQKKNIKGVMDNADRGNVFMSLFFLREILEQIADEPN